MQKRRGYNPKRSIAALGDWLEARRADLAKQARYGGNPEHKLRPSDYGLTPPRNPRPGKTLCDANGEFPRHVAERLLEEAFKRGMVSKRWASDWPQNVWVVMDGIVYEGQLENRAQGTYHGYPMTSADTFRQIVIEEWNRRG